MKNIPRFDFSGRVAVVTGAGLGIGFGIASALARAGARLVLNDAVPEQAQKALEKIQAAHAVEGCAIAGDVGTDATIQALMDAARERFGRLDMAVANAGLTLEGEFAAFPRESFNRLIQTNLAGSFFLAQAASAQMIRQESGGSILVLSSVLGHRACHGHTVYAMTKAALEMMARSLVLEFSGHDININAVAPGATRTERTESDPDYGAKWGKVTPMRRPATPEDIASAALFLLSAEARHITGQSLIVDGGWTSCSPVPGTWPL